MANLTEKPKRIQLSRQRGYRKPPGAVVCSRPGPWGNWYRVETWRDYWIVVDTESPDGAEEYIDPVLYQTKLEAQSAAVELFEQDFIDGYVDHFLERAKPALRGKGLACWCRLCPEHRDGLPLGVECEACDPCHVGVLLERVNE